MTSSLTMMPSSTSHPSPLTFRRCTTVTRPDHRQGLVIEYTLINPPGCPPQSPSTERKQQSPTPITSSCDTPKLPPLKGVESSQNFNSNNGCLNSSRRQRPWLGLSNSANTPTTPSSIDKKRRLERMNLRSENRSLGLQRASILSQRTNSSCKRSDSATNDSQKSVQTGNSLDDRLSEDRLRQISQQNNHTNNNLESFENKNEELTEEKMEQRRNFDKCMNWIDALPTKFSGMHIVQERAPVTHD